MRFHHRANATRSRPTKERAASATDQENSRAENLGAKQASLYRRKGCSPTQRDSKNWRRSTDFLASRNPTKQPSLGPMDVIAYGQCPRRELRWKQESRLRILA